jgi:hypothetical protein
MRRVARTRLGTATHASLTASAARVWSSSRSSCPSCCCSSPASSDRSPRQRRHHIGYGSREGARGLGTRSRGVRLHHGDDPLVWTRPSSPASSASSSRALGCGSQRYHSDSHLQATSAGKVATASTRGPTRARTAGRTSIPESGKAGSTSVRQRRPGQPAADRVARLRTSSAWRSSTTASCRRRWPRSSEGSGCTRSWASPRPPS